MRCPRVRESLDQNVIPYFPQMEKYPHLRDETERILGTFLREQEQKCKEHVSAFFDPLPSSLTPSPLL